MTQSPALIGRDAELARVAHRLRDRRLVTVVGPGGIGKTTLARAAADAVGEEFADGLRVIDLTVVDEGGAVPESLATQLGYTSFGALLDAPSELPVLVLIDNCEHVVDSVADAVAALLDACQMPTVLATSRTALGLPGEAVVPLGPLEVPPPGSIDGPAIRLFVERARDAGATIDASPTVAELCRRLDGVPLAIELAAARTRAMTPEEILARLADDLDVLHRPRHRSAPRHRSLRAAIDWSYQLLDADQRRLFDDLCIFAGPFDVVAAHAVASAAPLSVAETQDRLHDLVESSMVVADPDGPSTRYRILETVRALGRERLDATGRRRAVEDRFVDHVVSQANDIIERGASTWSAEALSQLGALYGNLASAVRWCIGNDDDPGRAFLLVAVLWGLVHQAHTEEIGQLAEQVLARWERSEHPLWADAAATAATCRYMVGDHEGAVDLANSALGRAERSPYAAATLRRVLAQSKRATGDTSAALEWFAAAADAARERGLVSMATEADAARAQILADLGRHDDALQLVEQAIAEAGAAGSAVGSTWATAIRGSILLRVDPVEATTVLGEALDRSRAIGYDAGGSVCLRALALAALCRGEPDVAARHALALLDDLLARGSTYELRMVLDVAAAVLAEVGRHEVAADLGATALALPVVSITASVGHELFPLDATGGTVRSARGAMVTTRTELSSLIEHSAGAAPPAGDAEPAPARTGTFRRLGDVWEIGLGGQTTTIRAAKGLADIARLLSSPDRELHCLDLAGASLDESGTGPMLDAAARRSYEDRIRELQAELDEADSNNDRASAERARGELDALVDELTAALGLGGAVRSSGASAERARSAVTQRIRGTIRRIETLDAPLGRHLHASIRTGTFCCYAPESPVVWSL